jgi:hypothetical protein
MQTTFKVTMVNAAGTEVGCLAVKADSAQGAMNAAEVRYPKFAAYTAEPLRPFDFSTVGGMMAAH